MTDWRIPSVAVLACLGLLALVPVAGASDGKPHAPEAIEEVAIVSAEEAAIGWLETRLDEEVEILTEACSIAHGFLRRALSAEVITAGRTTTSDVDWWLRQTVHDAGFGVWFQPTTSVQRAGGTTRDSFAAGPGETVIESGDLVHIDVGIVSSGYSNDPVIADYERHGFKGVVTKPYTMGELGEKLNHVLMNSRN